MNEIRVLAMIEASNVSGSAKAVLEFAREATRRHDRFPRVELSILMFDRGQGENCLTKAVRDAGIPLDIVSERRRFDFGVIPQLRSVVAKRHVDLIWSNSVKSHFLVRWAGLHCPTKWVAFHHGYTTVDAKMRIYNHLDRWSLRMANQVLTSSAAFIGELERSHVQRDHIHVQHMPIRPFVPVPEKQKAELRRRLGLDQGTRVLLTVGRLSREKGHLDLVQAFSRTISLACHSRLRLVIVGDGPERPRIERCCQDLGLAGLVTLTGQQEDVNPYYSIADVFVLPSHSEGCPNVLLEAMAAGVPVVATEAGGIPETVTNGKDAILVKTQDRDGLASATARILKDADLRDRLISAAREVVTRKTPEAYFKSIASVFRQACANAN